MLVAAPDPVVLFTEALERFQSTMKTGFDELQDELHEFKAAFHDDCDEMIQKIINVESESARARHVLVTEESDIETEEIQEVKSGGETTLISIEAWLKQSELSQHHISNQIEALESLVHIQVPSSNLEPSLQFHKESIDVWDDYYAGDVCDRAELSQKQIEVLHVKNVAENFANSTRTTPLLCAYHVFDKLLSRVKHKSMQSKLTKSWTFKYKIIPQQGFSVILAGVTPMRLHDERVVELWDSSSNLVYIKMDDSLYDESGYIGPEIEPDGQSDDEIAAEEFQEKKHHERNCFVLEVYHSEKKAHMYQQEIVTVKDDAVNMLLRLKQMYDSTVKNTEMMSLKQQQKVEELKAQLGEAEDIVRELRFHKVSSCKHVEVLEKSGCAEDIGSIFPVRDDEDPMVSPILLKTSLRYVSDKLSEMRKDGYEVRETTSLNTSMQGGLNYIMLQLLNIDGIRTILGQSIALDYYGHQVDGMVAEFTDIIRWREKTGTFTMDGKRLFQLVGKADSHMADVMMKLGIFERSDIAQIWEYLRDEFELTQRLSSLDIQLKLVEHFDHFHVGIGTDTQETYVMLYNTYAVAEAVPPTSPMIAHLNHLSVGVGSDKQHSLSLLQAKQIWDPGGIFSTFDMQQVGMNFAKEFWIMNVTTVMKTHFSVWYDQLQQKFPEFI